MYWLKFLGMKKKISNFINTYSVKFLSLFKYFQKLCGLRNPKETHRTPTILYSGNGSNGFKKKNIFSHIFEVLVKNFNPVHANYQWIFSNNREHRYTFFNFFSALM